MKIKNIGAIFFFLILIFIIFSIIFLLYFKQKTNENLIINQDFNLYLNQNPTPIIPLPETAKAHVNDNFSNWSIPLRTQIELWNIVQESPINEKTKRHFILFSVANAGMKEYIINSICSMKIAGIPKNFHVTIALDEEAYMSVKKIDANVVYFHSNFVRKAVNNRQIIDFYNIVKVRPTILYQLLLWDVEPIMVDSDTVFLSDPLHLFNDEADFEVQCDSKEYYKIPYNKYPVPWQVNLGYYKLHPTPSVLKLMPIWMEFMYKSPKVNDQSALRKILKKYPTFWLDNGSNDTVIVDTKSILGSKYPNLSFRFLDPMRIANAGGLYQDGKDFWRNESKKIRLDKPEFIHFFHIGHISQKMNTMKENNLIFFDGNQVCLKDSPHGVKEFYVWK